MMPHTRPDHNGIPRHEGPAKNLFLRALLQLGQRLAELEGKCDKYYANGPHRGPSGEENVCGIISGLIMKVARSGWLHQIARPQLRSIRPERESLKDLFNAVTDRDRRELDE